MSVAHVTLGEIDLLNRPVRFADSMQVDPSSFQVQSNGHTGQHLSGLVEPHSMGSEAIPAVPKKQPGLHLDEAKEMCSEGHELSESYRPQGLQSTPAGRTRIIMYDCPDNTV